MKSPRPESVKVLHGRSHPEVAGYAAGSLQLVQMHELIGPKGNQNEHRAHRKSAQPRCLRENVPLKAT